MVNENDVELATQHFDSMNDDQRIRLCRALAERARGDAKHASHPEPFLRIAVEWEKLASEIESQKALHTDHQPTEQMRREAS